MKTTENAGKSRGKISPKNAGNKQSDMHGALDFLGCDERLIPAENNLIKPSFFVDCKTKTVEPMKKIYSDRDPATGRFLPGNRAAVGARGNHYPKWGNKNALKHGFCSPISYIDKYGWLVIGRGSGPITRVPPELYEKGNGQICLRPGWEKWNPERQKQLKTTTSNR